MRTTGCVRWALMENSLPGCVSVWWWWWRSWEIGCFRQKAKRSGVLERKGFEREREVDWGQNNVCKGSQEDLLALLRGPGLSFSGGPLPQDVTWPGLWTAASRSSCCLLQAWMRSPRKPGERRGKGWEEGEGLSIAFVRLKTLIRNGDTLRLFMCQALCFTSSGHLPVR